MYGFPKELYDLKYKVSGKGALTKGIIDALGDSVTIDNSWGIDHGTWSVLVHMYPEANIPVVQLSIDAGKTPTLVAQAFEALTNLREQGYMILGSGNIVHGLRKAIFGIPAYKWAEQFDDYIQEVIFKREFDKCINYKSLGEIAMESAPTPDHYYPLLNLLGTVKDNDTIEMFSKDYMAGSISMTGYIFSND